MKRTFRLCGSLGAAICLILTSGAPAAAEPIDPAELARCLADSGTVFYGAHWCPYCAKQRERFGGSAHLLNYVECSENQSRKTNDRCRQANVRGFPTWVFPDGSRATGLHSLEELARASGCRTSPEV